MQLSGTYVHLRPMTLKERPKFFRWATQSDATAFWYGELYGDEVPSYVVFKHEWPDYYFTGSRPHKGRSFAIELAGEAIGQINYNEVNGHDQSVELDILIAKEEHQGKGYGTDAINVLTTFLFEQMNLRRCRIEVIAQNPRAYRAYLKAGFSHSYTYIRNNIEWFVLEKLPDEDEATANSALLPSKTSLPSANARP